MHKTMCNMCGRSFSKSLEHPVLGRVCQRCYQELFVNTQGKSPEEITEMRYRQAVLNNEFSSQIAGNPLRNTLYRAIADSLSRYQMALTGYRLIDSRIYLMYKGKYKRSDVNILISAMGGAVTVVIYNIKDTQKQNAYITRQFKFEEEQDNGKLNRTVYSGASNI